MDLYELHDERRKRRGAQRARAKAQPLRVLVLGATGFIGRHVAAALSNAGHRVVSAARGLTPPGIDVDFSRDQHPQAWRERLAGIDVVVNAVGILRETDTQTFSALHEEAPRALFQACLEAGVRKVIQISALGADAGAQSAYHRSKRRADQYLAKLPLDWVIVQPSLVFGLEGQSTRLFTTLAALPLVPLPGDGAQRVQPIHIDDLAAAIVRLTETDAFNRRVIAAVGPEPVALRRYLESLGAALGFPTRWFLPVPMMVMRAVAALGTRTSHLPLDSETLAMLERGNTAPAKVINAVLGREPRGVEQFIEPAHAPTLATAAQLAWLLPVLRASIALLWIITAILSLGVYPHEGSYALLARVGITGVFAPIALYSAATLDLLFGIGIYALERRVWRVWLWRAQITLIVGYSIAIAFGIPELWLHPFGPLLKNIPILAIIVLLHEFDRRPPGSLGSSAWST